MSSERDVEPEGTWRRLVAGGVYRNHGDDVVSGDTVHACLRFPDRAVVEYTVHEYVVHNRHLRGCVVGRWGPRNLQLPAAVEVEVGPDIRRGRRCHIIPI